MKLFSEPIESLSPRAEAWSFRWRGRLYHISSVVDRWVFQGKWWVAEERREYFLVHAEAGDIVGLYQLCLSSAQGWLLVGVYD